LDDDGGTGTEGEGDGAGTEAALQEARLAAAITAATARVVL
jgi:hypothetical protein